MERTDLEGKVGAVFSCIMFEMSIRHLSEGFSLANFTDEPDTIDED